MKGTIMKKLLTTLILTLLIIGISEAVDPIAKQRRGNAEPTVAELNKIYARYGIEDYQTAEQNLLNLSTTQDPKANYIYTLELGDFYLDKLNNYTKAESIYKLLNEKYPKHQNISDVYYRLGVTYEKMEKYLEAAQMYEIVATKYRNSPYALDALDAIERCFKKNYQELVAKIDGYPITRIEFDDRIAQAPGNYDTFDKKNQLLNDMISERLIYVSAISRGLDKTPEFKNQFSDIRKNVMFQAWYQREVVNKVKISESDKKKYYSKHKSEFITPEQVQAREILVKTKPEADSLYRLIITYNLKFDSVVQEVSLAPTKSEGGDLGYFSRGTQPKEIENIAFKLKPKTVSLPFYSETKVGYMLLKVDDYKPKKVRTYKDASAEIENKLRGERIDGTFKTKTDGFKQNSAITINDLSIKENLDTVAIIDGEVMTQAQINDYIAKIPPFYRSEFESPEGKKRILDQLILEKTWSKQLEKEKYYLFNSVFSQLLDAKKNTMIGNLRKTEVNEKSVLSDSEIQTEYKKNINEYKVAKQIRAREITVPTESLATEIRKIASGGKITFDSLARAYSTAPTKWMGGDMGFFSVGSKPKDIEQVAFKLNKNQISKVIKQNDSTYTIIKIEDVKDAYTKSFEDVKPVLQRKLRQMKDQSQAKAFTDNLRKSHQVETYLVDETPKPETPQQD